MIESIHATCGCGALRFAARARPIAQLVCHCTDCRAASGEPYTETAFFRRRDITITGDVTEQVFTAASGHRTARGSCSSCGDLLFDTSEKFPELLGVMIRHLQAPFVAKTTAHMWVKSRVPSVDIEDGLPRYSEGVL